MIIKRKGKIFFVCAGIVVLVIIAVAVAFQFRPREYITEFGLTFSHPAGWEVKAVKEKNAHFVTATRLSRGKLWKLFVSFYPAWPSESNLSCATFFQSKSYLRYADEFSSCEVLEINGITYTKVIRKRIVDSRSDVVLTTVIGDNFLRAQAVYNKSLPDYEKIFQSFVVDKQRASQPLLVMDYPVVNNVKELLVQDSFSTSTDLPMDFLTGYESRNDGYVVRVLNLAEKKSSVLPLINFSGEFAYLLPTNQLLYSSYSVDPPDEQGKMSRLVFRLYSLADQTDKIVAMVPDDLYGFYTRRLAVEKVDRQNGKIQILSGFDIEIGALRFLLDLEKQTFVSLGSEGFPKKFYECIEDPVCDDGAEIAGKKFVAYIDAYGLDYYELMKAYDNYKDKDQSLWLKYAAPSCQTAAMDLANVESQTRRVIGCVQD